MSLLDRHRLSQIFKIPHARHGTSLQKLIVKKLPKRMTTTCAARRRTCFDGGQGAAARSQHVRARGQHVGVQLTMEESSQRVWAQGGAALLEPWGA